MSTTHFVSLVVAAMCFVPAGAVAQTYSVVELATLSQGNAVIVSGPNGAGIGVGGGHVVDARSASGQRLGLLFESGGVRQVTGLPGSDDTVVFGLNDFGAWVGASNTATAVRGFSGTRAGATKELPPLPGDNASAAFDVNNLGQAVGFSSGSRGQSAVKWDANGAPTALPGSLGMSGSRGSAVNDRGDVAGAIGTASGTRPAVWPAGQARTELALIAGHTMGEAYSINARGDVVGYTASASAARRASLWRWSGGGVVDLGTLPGGSFSQAFGINGAGDIVGMSNSTAGVRAVLWRAGGAIQDLNTLVPPSSFVLTSAVGINDSGAILATGHAAVATAGGVHTHDDLHELPVKVFLLIRAGGVQ